MSILRIAFRYAKSLFDLSKEANTLDKVFEDITYIREVCKNDEFKAFLKNPIISIERKENVFNALFASKVEKLVLQVLKIVAEHRRELYLRDICREFIELYHAERHITKARLTTAEAISDEAVNKLIEEFRVAGLVQEKVILEREVNPAILGGFILAVNDQVYDASVEYKLDQLNNLFSENLYIKNY